MEYRSSLSLLGLPLLHINVGRGVNGTYRRGIAAGWIAIGDIAVGVLLSLGGVAVGGVSLGGLSLGALAFGGLALGLGSAGGFSAGLVAVGGAAFGWFAAIGGLAVAHGYAIGGVAIGEHALAPSHSGLRASFPHVEAPFRQEDALLFGVLAAALLLLVGSLARRIAAWRGTDETEGGPFG